MSYIMCNTVHISDVVCVVHVMYVASVLHNVRVAYVCHVHAYIGTCWYVYIACEFHGGHIHCIMCGTVGLVAITCFLLSHVLVVNLLMPLFSCGRVVALLFVVTLLLSLAAFMSASRHTSVCSLSECRQCGPTLIPAPSRLPASTN